MRNQGWKAARLGILTVAMTVFGGAVITVFAGDEPPGEHGSPAEGHSKITHPAEPTEADVGHDAVHGSQAQAHEKDPSLAGGCLSDVSALEDLKRRKGELEAKQKELVSKEAELKARERALSDEMSKLAEARDDIARIEDSGKKMSEEKVAKLVETIEGMNPKAGSALISNIDEPLAVAAMTRLSTPKLSKLMNVMEPVRSTRLSELMAGVVRAKRPNKPASKSAPGSENAETTIQMPAKQAKGGGEKQNDAKYNEQANGRGAAGTERQPASQRQ